jgi:Fe-S-cluster containining protein
MPALELDLTTIIEQAGRLRDDYEAFGHYIDIMWERESRSDAGLDALVDEIAAEVIPQIDCTACANCCRSLVVGLTPDDIPPLADALNLPPGDVIALYVDREAGKRHAEWGVFRSSPCLLLDGHVCSVYAHRPQSCRDYPALTPDFRWLRDEILQGVGRCPIIFNVIERLKVRLGW